MGSIKIQDTGYIDSRNKGTQLSSANRANNGTAITLKVAEFTPSLKRNYSVEPNLATNQPAEVNLGSLENMQFILRCILNTTSSTDMDLVQHLLNLVRTWGYKVMWYDYTSATNEKNNGQLIYQIAINSQLGRVFSANEMTAFSIGTAFYRLGVHLTDIQPKHTGSNGLIIYQLSGVVIPVQTDELT